MKIIILKGGLGNQLFQVAYAYYLAKKKQHRIVLFTGLLGSYKAKREFYFSDYFGQGKDNIKVRSSFVLAYLIRVFAFILEPIFPKSIFMESSKKYSEEQNLKSAFVIDAYLQRFTDAEYFDFILNDITFAAFIQSSLQPHFIPWKEQVVFKQSCLHIRGNDLKYLFNLEQLKLVVNQLLAKLAMLHPEQPVTLVTDDVTFAQTLLAPINKVNFQSKNWQIDFLTLANAQVMGLIDSTFSIWAGVYGLILFPHTSILASLNSIQKYPLLIYLYQQQRLKRLEDVEWK